MIKTDRILLFLGSFTALACWSLGANAAVDVVNIDLEPAIREGIKSPIQFAVHVPHSVSSSKDGDWSTIDGVSTWRYSVRIPTAISMSLHANRVSVPKDAVLTIASTDTTLRYDASKLTNEEFWSRVQPGDTLDLTLQTAEPSRVIFEISSFQAGYRALGSGIKDHPYFTKMQVQLALSDNSQCVQNYQCNVTAANSPLAQATVAIVVANTYQCTGTLINNIANDNTPYVLTARHCESGQLGGGNPSAASSVTIYWNATTSCGTNLGKIYDPAVVTQTGATTVVEQQDAWLIQLNNNPVVTNAYFAGFDAAGGAVQGGYTIHHALSSKKQFTAWFGTAATVQRTGVLGSTYVSDFLETVNQLGNIGPGASGAGLMDQNDRLVGSLSLGRTTNDPSGYGSCPSTPAAPNGSNGVADFTSLAAIWNSTADATSSTGTLTLKSVLDPGNTGATSVSSVPAANITLAANATSQINVPVSITWSAPSSAQCTATGGLAGDGWSGTLANSGTMLVTETVPGSVKYGIACTLSGGRKISTSTNILWLGPTPQVTISSTRNVWTTRPASITWKSNIQPCVITGGNLSQSGLAASGTITTTQDSPGDVTYKITCGTATDTTTVSYSTPSLFFEANSTDRVFGEPLFLDWTSYADSCIPSGGGSDDHWSSSTFGASNSLYVAHVPTTGLYAYSLSCSSGPITVQKTLVVNIANGPGYVTTSVDRTSLTYSGTPADYLVFKWKSNLTSCTPASTPYVGNAVPGKDPPRGSSYYPEDQRTVAPPRSGTYIWTVTCSTVSTVPTQSVTSAPVVVTILPPPAPTASISVSSSSLLQKTPVVVTWSSTNARSCLMTGTIPPGTIWASGGHLASSGTLSITPNTVGQFTIGVSCESVDDTVGSAAAQTSITVTPAIVSVSAALNSTSITRGDSLTLNWSSANATSCSASGGGADGLQWTGTLATSGSITQVASLAGQFTYIVTCSNASTTNQAQATVMVNAPPSSGGASGGGGGGGAGVVEIGLLLQLLYWRLRRFKPANRSSRSH